VTAPPTPAALEAAPELDAVRRRLRGHGGDLRIRAVDEHGDVDVEFLGACNGCPAIGFTFTAVVEPTLRGLGGVRGVKSRQARYSRFVAERVRHLCPAPDLTDRPRT
jgi:Fe-S cluster biogenesis protein NfuA